MGFVMLGISTLTDVGINAYHRHGGPRPHHRPPVLHRRLDGPPLPHPGDGPPRRSDEADADHGRHPRFTAMASLGLPGLAGFWGEFMSLVSSYNPLDGLSHRVRSAMVAGAIGTVLTAGYMLYMLQQVNFGEPSDSGSGKLPRRRPVRDDRLGAAHRLHRRRASTNLIFESPTTSSAPSSRWRSRAVR